MKDISMVAKRIKQAPKYTLIIPRRVLHIFVAVITLCSIIQVAIGADFIVVLLAYLGVLTGTYGLFLLKKGSFASLLLFTFMFGSIGFAVIVKTLYFQQIDQYLHQPLVMFFLEDVMILELLLIGMLIDQVRLGKPLLDSNLKMLGPKVLDITAWTFFGLGALGVFTGLSSYSANNVSGNGALNFLDGFVYLGIICATLSSIVKNNRRVKFTPSIVAMISIASVFGLLNDSKADVFLPTLTFLLSIAFLRGTISKLKLIGALFVVVFLVKAFTPIIHVARGNGIQQQSISARISTLGGLVYQSFFSDSGNVVEQEFTSDVGAYYNYFGPNGTPFATLILQRFTSVVQSDPVVDAVLNKGTIGYSIIQFSFFEILPSFIVKKTIVAQTGYLILRRYGIVGATAGLHPTVPLLGCGFAMGGIPGVILLSFFVFFSLLAVVKKIAGSLQSNVFGLFLFIESGAYCFSTDIGQYVGIILRTIPLLSAVILLYELVVLRFLLRDSATLRIENREA